MRKTILIPTDFTVMPLLLLKHAAVNENCALDILFLYGTLLPDSITDLLFYSPKKILDTAMSSDFREGCAVIQNKYPEKIQSIRFEVFHGRSTDAFKTLVSMQKVDEVLIPLLYTFREHENSFNPVPLILKSGVPVMQVIVEQPQYISEGDLLAGLLTSTL